MPSVEKAVMRILAVLNRQTCDHPLNLTPDSEGLLEALLAAGLEQRNRIPA